MKVIATRILGKRAPASEGRTGRGASALRGAGGVALIVGLGMVALLVWQAVTTPSRALTVEDLPLGNAGTPEFAADLVSVQSARYSGVDVSVVDPPAGLLWLDFANEATTLLVVAVLAGLVVWIARATSRGRPFTRNAGLALALAGVVVAVAGIAGDVLRGRLVVGVVALLGPESTAGADVTGSYEGLVSSTNVALFPDVLAGLALVVLGGAFAVGSRLQRDTDGLV